MSTSVQSKKGTAALTVSADQVLGTFDISNCNGFSVQLNGIVGTTGSMKVQQSNDNTLWEDVPSATSTLAASEANIINVTSLYTLHVRVLVTITAAAGNYSWIMVGKVN